MKKIFLLIGLAFSLSINAQESELSKTISPDLLKQFYAFELWSNVSIVLLMLCISYVIYFLTKKFVEIEGDIILYVINAIQFIPLVILFNSVYKIILISVAPKLYLIEYFIN